jgi:DGQHR domain-containing protein
MNMAPATAVAPSPKMIESTEGFVIHQNGHESYVVKFKAGDLVDHLEVAHCDPTTPDGYQRPESKKRTDEISDFTLDGGEIPPALILSSRKKPVAFGKGRYGWLVPLFTIDGQHRGIGIRKAVLANPKLKDFEIACIIKAGLTVEEEAQLFLNINRPQVKVSVAIAQAVKFNLNKTDEGKALLAASPASISPKKSDGSPDLKSDWEVKAYKLALMLNNDGGILPAQNPLQGRIKLVTSGQDDTVKYAVTQGTVIRSLETTVVDTDIDQRSVGSFLAAYWRGIAMTWTKEVASPSDHTLIRTLGVEILNRAFPTVFRLVKDNGGDVTNPMHYRKVLKLSDGWKKNPWATSNSLAKQATSKGWYGEKTAEFLAEIKRKEYSLIKGF